MRWHDFDQDVLVLSNRHGFRRQRRLPLAQEVKLAIALVALGAAAIGLALLIRMG